VTELVGQATAEGALYRGVLGILKACKTDIETGSRIPGVMWPDITSNAWWMIKMRGTP